MIAVNRPPQEPGPSGEDSPRPQFQVGQIVEHRRYGYRGVVVDFDGSCQAQESWYLKNQTQPKRSQPWYHVLVDGADHTTYAAQENLRPAVDVSPVDHPLVEYFFYGYLQGQYLRNNRPWPETW